MALNEHSPRWVAFPEPSTTVVKMKVAGLKSALKNSVEKRALKGRDLGALSFLAQASVLGSIKNSERMATSVQFFFMVLLVFVLLV